MTMKAAALRGSSTLAIGRSMRRIVLPGLITVCAMSVIPENQLSAYGTANPAAHFAGTILAPAADRGSPDQGVRPFGIEGPAPRSRASQIGLQTAVPGSGRDWPLTPVTGSGDPVPLAPGGGLMDYSLEAVLEPNRRTAVAGSTPQAQTVDYGGSHPSNRATAKLQFGADITAQLAASLAATTDHTRAIVSRLADDIDLAAKAFDERLAHGQASAQAPQFGLPMSGAGPLVAGPPSAAAGDHLNGGSLVQAVVPLSTEAGNGLLDPDQIGAFAGLSIAAIPELAAASARRDAGPDAPIEALPGLRPYAQERVPAVLEGSSEPHLWTVETEPASFAQLGTENLSGVDAVIDQDGVTLVKVGALVEMLSEQFDLAELARIRSSDARLHYLPVEALQRAGIPVIYDRGNETLQLSTNLAQASGSAQGGGGTSGDAGTGSAGATGNKSLLATASVGFDSNPFLSANESPEAVSLRLQLNPSITRSDGRSSVRASGRVEHIEYLGEYGSLQNFGADLSGRYRLNERLEANAAALFRSDILGTDLTNPLSTGAGIDPDIPVIPGGNDVTILGQRQRRTQYGADTGLTFTPSERDQISWSLAWRSDRFGSDGLSDSDFFSQQLRYSRQVSGDLTLGAIVDASIINFTNANFGDAQTVTPQALVVFSLSERLKATGSLGFALTRIETPAGDETTRAVAGNLSLCYDGERSNLCLNGSRQVLPSAIGGARVQTVAGLSYSLRLSERDSLQLGGNYSIASQPLAAIGNDFESINAFARYERRLSERSRLFVSGGYLDTSGNNALNATNLQAVMGITINLGSGQ